MTARVPLVAGNWKLHKTLAESTRLADALVAALPSKGAAEVAVAPVFTALAAVGGRIADSHIGLSSQDIYWEEQGAFTGEVGPLQLTDLGCTYAIVGHSERRQYFGETDAHVARKAAAALAHGIIPIICVGETLATREAGDAEAWVVAQVKEALGGMSADQAARVVLAYEPIWAIGTGRTASPSDAEQMHQAIRTQVEAIQGAGIARGMRILYGGSVKASNAGELMIEANVDGALVGGASLDAESFAAIVAAAG